MTIIIITFFLVTAPLIVLSIKWELDRKISFAWAFFMGLVSSLTVALIKAGTTDLQYPLMILIAWIEAGILSVLAVLALFFRDPERTPPALDGLLVSPADGMVKYVKEITKGEFPFSQKNGVIIPLKEFSGIDLIADGGIQVGIGMTLLDVHVNRSPIPGKISHLRRIPGKFASLKKIGSLLENERVVAVVEGKRMKIGVVLIASRLVRRICTYLDEGETVEIGQRIGMIRFGSQVDVLIPKNESLKITVKSGDKVKAGASIIATF